MTANDRQPGGQSEASQRLAARARSFVRENFASEDGCSTSLIATELGVSRSLLCHRYRSAYGVTIGNEIRRLRINLALRLLSDDPVRLIKEVAAEAGYMRSSYRAFLNAFRAETGMSPTEYQRRTTLGQTVEKKESPQAQANGARARRRAAG